MEGRDIHYKQEVAFINRQKELNYLQNFIDKRPSEILFVYGPKSSGKTTLLYRFFEQAEREQKLEVKFVNLRKVLVGNNKNLIRIFFKVEDEEKRGHITAGISAGFFKIDSHVEKKMAKGDADPFLIMKQEFARLNKKGVKPVVILDELQAIDHIYMNGGKDRQLIIELFNFFVAMTKESHLAHIIIASSDGYFINTVYNDSRLKKTSEFFKVDFLGREDVTQWLSDLETHSGITDYKLTPGEIEAIWQDLGGSAWEIQNILTHRFNGPLDIALEQYRKKIKGMITYYVGFDAKKKSILEAFAQKEKIPVGDLGAIDMPPEELENLLKEMVRNNILYFDPTEAAYSSQGRSYYLALRSLYGPSNL